LFTYNYSSPKALGLERFVLKKPELSMTLRECLSEFPQLEETIYSLIEECVYCEGFKDETLEKIFKAHKLDPEKALKKLLKALEEEG